MPNPEISQMGLKSGVIVDIRDAKALRNINISGPSEGQALVYNSVSQKWENRDIGLAESITYADLVDLRDNGNLVPGQTYQITDYVTMINPYCMPMVNFLILTQQGSTGLLSTIETNRVSTDYQYFDILVTAIDDHTLSEDCRMAKHGNSTFFDDLDLPSWRIKYRLDNDDKNFDFACNYYDIGSVTPTSSTEMQVSAILLRTYYGNSDQTLYDNTHDLYALIMDDGTATYTSSVYILNTSPIGDNTPLYVYEDGTYTQVATIGSVTHHLGKGVIYYMKDMNDNKIGYDFVNIQFKRFYTDKIVFKDFLPTGNEKGELEIYGFNNDYTTPIYYTMTESNLNQDSYIKRTVDITDSKWLYTLNVVTPDPETENAVLVKNAFNLCHNVTMQSCPSICGYGVNVARYCLPDNVLVLNLSGLVYSALDFTGYLLKDYPFKYINDLTIHPGCLFNTLLYNMSIDAGFDITKTSQGIDLRYCIMNIFQNINANMHYMIGNIIKNSILDLEKIRFSYISTSINTGDDRMQSRIGSNNTALYIENADNNSSLYLGNGNNRIILKPFGNCVTIGNGCNDIYNSTYEGHYTSISNIHIGNGCSDIHFIDIPIDSNYSSSGVTRCIRIDDFCSCIDCYKADRTTLSGIHVKNTIPRYGDSAALNLKFDDLEYPEIGVYQPTTNYWISVGTNKDGVYTAYVEHDIVDPIMSSTLSPLTYSLSGNQLTITSTDNNAIIYANDGKIPMPFGATNIGSLTIFAQAGHTYYARAYSENLWEPPTPVIEIVIPSE